MSSITKTTLFGLPPATLTRYSQTCLAPVAGTPTYDDLQTESGFYEQARKIAFDAMRKMKASYEEKLAYREDWVQEAILHLYDACFIQFLPFPQAYARARGQVMTAIALSRDHKSGGSYAYCKRYWTQDGLVERDGTFAERGLTTCTLAQYDPSPYGADTRPRPVEDAVIRRQERPDRQRTREWVEREVTKVLVAIHNRQWHPNSIQRAAKILTQSGFGMNVAAIMQELNVSRDFVEGTLSHYRNRLRQALPADYAPLFVGLLRARGELMIQWWDDMSLEIINGGKRRSIVVMPYGAFTVSYEKLDTPYPRARLQTGRRIQGKPVNRSVNLGRLGTIGYEDIFHGTHKIAEKMAELAALANKESGYANCQVVNNQLNMGQVAMATD